MRALRHGYTNRTRGDGAMVEKRHDGPDAPERHRREHHLLTALHGRVPVPPVTAAAAGLLRLGFVDGTPGQELMETGDPESVMRACGRVLRRVHDLPTALLPGTGQVVVHGDFGPHNLLIDPVDYEVTALVDWEFAHLGDPVEDLAWCEWTVRAHHRRHLPALAAFFDAYGGPVPPWPTRKAAMTARCASLRSFCARWESNATGERTWERRMSETAAWTE